MIEAKPNMIRKYNKPMIGFGAGMILPMIAFFGYYIYVLTQNDDLPLMKFLETLYNTDSFTAVMSLCVVPNIAIFFLFKKLEYWYAIKGVVTSVLIYTMLVLLVKIV